MRYTVATRSATDAACRGGDVFDLRVDRDGAVWLMIADVSAKGSLGRLHAEMLRRAFAAAGTCDTSPSVVMARLNDIRFDVARADLQVHIASAFIARIDAASTELTYASAGHDVALVFRGRAHHHLEPTGPVLGILPDAIRAERTIGFDRPSMLLLATDGFTEARCAVESTFAFGTTGLVSAVLQS